MLTKCVQKTCKIKELAKIEHWVNSKLKPNVQEQDSKTHNKHCDNLQVSRLDTKGHQCLVVKRKSN